MNETTPQFEPVPKKKKKKVGVTPGRRARLAQLRRELSELLDRLQLTTTATDREEALEIFIDSALRVASYEGLRTWRPQKTKSREQAARDSLQRFLGGASCFGWVEKIIRDTVKFYGPEGQGTQHLPLHEIAEGGELHPMNEPDYDPASAFDRTGVRIGEAIGEPRNEVPGDTLTVMPERNTNYGTTLGDQIVLAHFKGDSEAVLQLARQVDAEREGR